MAHPADAGAGLVAAAGTAKLDGPTHQELSGLAESARTSFAALAAFTGRQIGNPARLADLAPRAPMLATAASLRHKLLKLAEKYARTPASGHCPATACCYFVVLSGKVW